jgi:hypothetical protein
MWNSETIPEVTVGEESMQESNAGNIGGHTNLRADAPPFQTSTYFVSVTPEVFSTQAAMSSGYSTSVGPVQNEIFRHTTP